MKSISTIRRDPLRKMILRRAYGVILGAHAFATARRRRGDEPRLYYAGARAGDVGGPLVKVKRLIQQFPQRLWDYNLVYVLSNTAYLPSAAVRWLRRVGTPIVHNQNGVYYPAWYGGDWRAANARMAVTYHLADHVFWQSDFCRRAASRYLGERTGSGDVLYNAVDTIRFAPEPRNDGGGGQCRFLMTGKFDTHSFYRLAATMQGLAHARKRGLDATLICAGWIEPAALGAAGQLADNLQIASAVRFNKPYTQDAAPDVYRAADVYITTTHMDACPNAVIEAMSSGLPVLYCATGGVPELVGIGAGIGLDAPEDWDRTFVPSPESVANGMMRISESRQHQAVAARQRAVSLFDLSDWMNRHDAVFRRLCRA